MKETFSALGLIEINIKKVHKNIKDVGIDARKYANKVEMI